MPYKQSCQDCSLYNLCLPLGLQATQLDLLHDSIKRHLRIKKGETLYKTNDVFNNLYAVQAGAFKSIISQTNNEHITNFYLPSEVLGFDGIHQKKHVCSVIALENSSVCEISFSSLFEVAQKVPQMQMHLFSLMSQEIKCEAQANIPYSANIRLANFLLNLSARFKRRQLSANCFQLPMTRQDIANHLGLANETVSRLFADFQQKGLLTINKRELTILSSQKLADLLKDS